MDLPKISGFNGPEERISGIYEALSANTLRHPLDCGEAFSSNVALFLLGIGREKYIDLFQAEDIGVEVLKTLTNDDLRAIGIDDEDEIAFLLDKFSSVNFVDTREVIVSPSTDCLIINRMVEKTNQLTLIIYEMVINLQRTKIKPKDFQLSRNYSQIQVLNLILDRVIAYTEQDLRLTYDERNKTGLGFDIIRKDNLTLPKFLKRKLNPKREIRKPVIILMTISVVGVILSRLLV